jgi:PRTRC genetic system ThiF family protein
MIIKPLKVMFDREAPVQVILAGCGGTGGFIAWDLARIAYHLREAGAGLRLTFVDPDLVEDKNIGRQNFCPAELGLPKAGALARRYNLAYGLDIGHLVAPVEEYKLFESNVETVIFVGAVDSARARVQIRKQLNRCHNRLRMWWVDCGNEYQGGQVLAGNAQSMSQYDHRKFMQEEKLGLCSQVPLPDVQHPELVDTGRKVAALPCALAAAREEQSLMVNRAVATFASQILYKMLVKRELDVMAVYVGLDSCSVRPVPITRENVLKCCKPQKKSKGESHEDGDGGCGLH